MVNSLINRPSFELPVPGYNYCGPGTKLKKRLAKNDLGVNLLDDAYKTHDIAYVNTPNIADMHDANKILEEAAPQRLVAFGVKGVMNLKGKQGMRMKKKTQRKVKKGEDLKKSSEGVFKETNYFSA